MGNTRRNHIIYILLSAGALTSVAALFIFSLKDSICGKLLQSAEEFALYSGPCVSDGIGFMPMVFAIYAVSAILVSANLWFIKYFKM